MSAKRIIITGALTVLLLAGSAAAQTTTPTSTGALPGSPNAGSGGNAPANILLLTGSAAVALGGAAMLVRPRAM